MEIVKVKKINILVFVLAIGFLFLASCAFGQNKMSIVRQDGYDVGIKKVTKIREASYGLVFDFNRVKEEEIYIGISSDSINKDVVSPVLYAYIPTSVNGKGIDISILFEDGTKEVFKQISCTNKNYIEYEITHSAYIKLINLKFKQVEFIGLGKYSDILEESYFVRFFKLLG